MLRQISDRQVIWQDKILSCRVGRAGFSNTKREGDGYTPTGSWQLLKVYYRSDRIRRPSTSLPCVAITADMGWSDDTTDPAYNQLVKTPYPFSHEQLFREDTLYDLLITINHNTNPIVPGKGSAIFIHQMHENETPTAGCLALRLHDLIHVVETVSLDTCWVIGADLA